MTSNVIEVEATGAPPSQAGEEARDGGQWGGCSRPLVLAVHPPLLLPALGLFHVVHVDVGEIPPASESSPTKGNNIANLRW